MEKESAKKEELCMWIDSDEGYYSPSCGGGDFSFNDAGPIENGFKFCPYCAKEIQEG